MRHDQTDKRRNVITFAAALALGLAAPPSLALAQSSGAASPASAPMADAPSGGVPQSGAPESDVKENDADTAETVVVTGMRLKTEKLQEIIGDFVRDHGKRAPYSDQIARWDKAVCPQVQNAPADIATFVTTRIRAIAQAVGAPTSRGSCKTNVNIFFTDQPQVLMDVVADKYPRLLGYHFVHQAKALSQVTKPIQAWYVTSTSNGILTAIDDPYEMSVGGGLGSRLSTGGLRPVLTHVLLVVNTDRILGQKLGAVADYLGALALAQPKAVDQCGDLPSILDLFAGNCADNQKPKTLSVADKAYLEGLYAMDPWEIGTLQRSGITMHMWQSFGAP
ncbi:hypothetical protein UAJ10_02480 [Nitrospirillum sp. BR 11164]|uniref:hypothetical protein n=1 Tax=Nitrospirillum sp. BR 11164 TaxID=3104324 RepID=UPI002AFECF6A|nr:hypothetical protein [Nitrospirillum sp. BR 11164]MEA1647882.1 hypothetical protein [Nitrospirillum sp. BR 11164]